MSGVSFPVTRQVGRALVVANSTSRPSLITALTKLGFECGECDDPYTATLELCRRRLVYRALILSLSSLYREELSLIATVKRRFPHVEIWLAHTDGRQAALAESMRLGADGLLDDEGLHRIAAAQSQEPMTYHAMPHSPMPSNHEPVITETSAIDTEQPIGEPVLTADELRALLQDQPAMPPSSVEKES
jgi:hypothetical protein